MEKIHKCKMIGGTSSKDVFNRINAFVKKLDELVSVAITFNNQTNKYVAIIAYIENSDK